ncbi:hypothetical protein [Oceanobacillus jordanicus]|uniref:Uncharacterized protein n=1 Tax=Oceanobacillus jordanicus TaxID=2867266 RepID=A0AAW5B470_9BACI|nr:hypothetical protein [Oceanobacillus jordanicus]MCG3418338.1 hypothetical protein [Oceanobacillus jordanicus]
MRISKSLFTTLVYFIVATLLCTVPIYLCTVFIITLLDWGSPILNVMESIKWSLKMMLIPSLIVLPVYLIVLSVCIHYQKEVDKVKYFALVLLVFIGLFLYYYNIART